jgi:hypothetical protein
MIGRGGDVHDLVERVREGQHCTLVGPRRIAKTTVCNAACERLRAEDDFIVVHIETPEQASASAFCQELIDRYTRISATDETQQVRRAARPLLERLLESLGIPLDLSEFGAEVPPATRRAILELPLRLVEQTGRDVVLFADERELEPRMPRDHWRQPLRERFQAAEMQISAPAARRDPRLRRRTSVPDDVRGRRGRAQGPPDRHRRGRRRCPRARAGGSA